MNPVKYFTIYYSSKQNKTGIYIVATFITHLFFSFKFKTSCIALAWIIASLPALTAW